MRSYLYILKLFLFVLCSLGRMGSVKSDSPLFDPRNDLTIILYSPSVLDSNRVDRGTYFRSLFRIREEIYRQLNSQNQGISFNVTLVTEDNVDEYIKLTNINRKKDYSNNLYIQLFKYQKLQHEVAVNFDHWQIQYMIDLSSFIKEKATEITTMITEALKLIDFTKENEIKFLSDAKMFEKFVEKNRYSIVLQTPFFKDKSLLLSLLEKILISERLKNLDYPKIAVTLFDLSLLNKDRVLRDFVALDSFEMKIVADSLESNSKVSALIIKNQNFDKFYVEVDFFANLSLDESLRKIQAELHKQVLIWTETLIVNCNFLTNEKKAVYVYNNREHNAFDKDFVNALLTLKLQLKVDNLNFPIVAGKNHYMLSQMKVSLEREKIESLPKETLVKFVDRLVSKNDSFDSKIFSMRKSFTLENVKEFVSLVLGGKVQYTGKSQLEVENERGEVNHLVATNFRDIVLNNDGTEYLVRFSARWSGHCKILEPLWTKLAEKFSHNDKLVIARVEAYENQIPELVDLVQGVPGIFFYSAYKKSIYGLSFDYERTFEGFMSFLRKNSYYQLDEFGAIDERMKVLIHLGLGLKIPSKKQIV